MNGDQLPQSLLDRTLALAALFKFLQATRPIAERGEIDMPTLSTAVHSILSTDSESMQDVFGDSMATSDGLRLLKQLLLNKIDQSRVQLMRDAVLVFHLERKLAKRPPLLQQISSGITQAKHQLEYFHSTHDSIVSNLGEVYAQTISQLSPKIMIHGEQHHLTNINNVRIIRTLLLASIRCAVAWRQKGGSRWQMLFRKKALLAATNHLLVTN